MAEISFASSVFTVACVATGTNAGVEIFPWGVFIIPVRARDFFDRRVIVKRIIDVHSIGYRARSIKYAIVSRMDRKEAKELLYNWVESPNLRKHMYAVAAAMEFYAKKFKKEGESDRWWMTGLLHDLDYEKYPNEHPQKAVGFLKEKIDQEMGDAIMAHVSHTNVPRASLMAKTLFAVDELTGMIVAVALVKPDKKLSSVDIESVKKRFKEKRFAAGVNREEIIQGAQELGVSLDEHIQNVIDAMRSISNELGL